MLQGAGIGIFDPAALELSVQGKGKKSRIVQNSEWCRDNRWSCTRWYRRGLQPFLSILHQWVGVINSVIVSLQFLREKGIQTVKAGFNHSIKTMLLKRDIILICLAAFLAELCFAALEIIVPLVGSSFGFSNSLVGVILSSCFLAFTVLQVPIGFLAERVGKRKVVVSASFMGAIPFVILYFSNNLLEMIFSMGVLGVMLRVVFVQFGALVAKLSPKGKESLYMAFFDAVIDFFRSK